MKELFFIMSMFLFFACNTKKETEWFNSGEWKNGIHQNLANKPDVKLFYEQYNKRPDLWKAAFKYLKQDLTAVKAGSYDLGDGMRANITEYYTKLPEKAKWEVHRNCIDIQYVISGKEKTGYKLLKDCILAGDYNPKKDVQLFEEQEGNYDVGNQDNIFIFFPKDAHRPSLQISEAEYVKKLVIKIPVAE
ncbi:MAG: YhcH/YjgK/YiaL family protein [Tannerella sp.]|jgi:YhcH/YjgK/YiaL family protein|nr:YhcH/YjgK/YiaL family protein [Tannerella sp.]